MPEEPEPEAEAGLGVLIGKSMISTNLYKDKIMKRNIILTTLFSVCFIFSSCADEGYPVFYPGTSVKDEGGDNPEPPATVTSPDYTRLTADNHPRVIFTDADFESIAETVKAGTNTALTQIHTAIINKATGYVGAADLERVLSGKRLLSVSRNAEERILFCAYAYKTTGEARYLEQAENDIQTVCRFSDWNARQHFLDVGEMAAGVALGYDWLYNDLSSDTKELARKALNDFAFAPANDGVWNLNFYEAESNWNQVCNGGLVCAALAVYEDNQSVAQGIIDKALESNVPAMEGMYSPDGNYPEGYSYWCYGTLYEALMLTAMETATGSDNGLSSTEGFSKTGKYMVFMEGPSGLCFNYSDCAPSTIPCLAQWYFAWKFDDLSVLYLEQDRISRYSSSSESRLLPLIAYYAADIAMSEVSAPEDYIFRGGGTTPVVLVHDTWTMDLDDKFLGIKGGQGNSSHSHLDAGSFVYDYNGTRWAADLGLQSYGTLEPYIDLWDMNDGSERWTAFRYNNLNHNTISVNGSYYRVAGAGEITGLVNDSGRKGATVDISAPLSNEVASAVRTIYIDGDDLVVTDNIMARSDKTADVRWTMVTQAQPTIEYGAITLVREGKYMYLTKTSSTGHNPTWTTWSTVSENSWDASNTGYYECGYTITLQAGETATITVRLTPEDPMGA